MNLSFKRNRKETAEHPLLQKKKRFSKKQKLIAIFVIVALLVSGTVYASIFAEKPEALAMDQFTSLSPSEFATKVNATGTIAADKDIDVYTTQTAPVKTIFVSEGESVKKGTVLAQLDDKELRQQIRVKEASLGVTAKNAAAQVASARNKYNAAVRALQQGNNSSLVAASNALETAKFQWQAAEKTWADYKKALNEGYHSDLSAEESAQLAAAQAVKNAELNVKQATDLLSEAQLKYNQAKSDVSFHDKRRKDLRKERDDKQMKISAASRDTGSNDLASAEAAEAQAEAEYDRLQYEADLLNDKKNATDFNSLSDEEKKAITNEFNAKQSAADYARTVKNQKHAEANAARSYYQSKSQDVDRINREMADIQNKLSDAETDYSRADSEKSSWEQQIVGRKDSLKQAKLTLKHAKESEELSQKSRKNTKKTRKDILSTYRQSADAAKNAYEQAQKSLRSAQAAASDEIQSYEDSLRTSEAAANDSASHVELANMYENLKDMTIRAPMDGVVTKQYANEGSSATGALFKIENTQALIIKTDLKAFDLQTVRTGMPVEIKTDATDDEIFHGRVVAIADTAKTSVEVAASAESSSPSGASGGNDPAFEAKIIVENPSSKLLVGMKTRLNIITAEDQNVYTVPFNAVMENADGQKSIFVAERVKNKDDLYRLKSIPVETSLENDLNIVIHGKKLKDGLLVLNEPADKSAGSLIKVTANSEGAAKETETST